jgi:hypothetical protein
VLTDDVESVVLGGVTVSLCGVGPADGSFAPAA